MKKKPLVLFEDDHLVFINKPSGLLSIPDRYQPEKPNLYHLLNKKYGKIYIVHRLDYETSGVICFAKTDDAHRNVSLQFENRQVKKIYLVLVQGTPHPPEGIIGKPIIRSKSHTGKMIVNRSGKPALTHYKTIENFRGLALVEADIKTGRTHQIRVHFQAIGHPLAVDNLYGGKDFFLLSQIKGKAYRLGKGKEERPLMDRTTLHAARLTITHPESGIKMTVEAPLPKDFGAVIRQLRKWAQV